MSHANEMIAEPTLGAHEGGALVDTPGLARARARSRLLVCLLLACGCGGGGGPGELVVPPGCNPLASEVDCLLPYPSDFFLVDDPSLPSGKRVALGEAAMVLDAEGASLDLAAPRPAGRSRPPAVR